jgi:hypothetical protein
MYVYRYHAPMDWCGTLEDLQRTLDSQVRFIRGFHAERLLFCRMGMPQLNRERSILMRRYTPLGNFYDDSATWEFRNSMHLRGDWRPTPDKFWFRWYAYRNHVGWPFETPAVYPKLQIDCCFGWTCCRKLPDTTTREDGIRYEDEGIPVAATVLQETFWRFRCRYPGCSETGSHTVLALCDKHLLEWCMTSFTDNLRMFRPFCRRQRSRYRHPVKWNNQMPGGALCLGCRGPASPPIHMDIFTQHWVCTNPALGMTPAPHVEEFGSPTRVVTPPPATNPRAPQMPEFIPGLKETRTLVFCRTCLMRLMHCVWLSLQATPTSDVVTHPDWLDVSTRLRTLLHFAAKHNVMRLRGTAPTGDTLINALVDGYIHELRLAKLEPLPPIVVQLLRWDTCPINACTHEPTNKNSCASSHTKAKRLWTICPGTAATDHRGCTHHVMSITDQNIEISAANWRCTECFAAPRFWCLACLTHNLRLGVPLCSWPCILKHSRDRRCRANGPPNARLRVANGAVTQLTATSLHWAAWIVVVERDEHDSFPTEDCPPGRLTYDASMDFMRATRSLRRDFGCVPSLYSTTLHPVVMCECNKPQLQLRCVVPECRDFLNSYCQTSTCHNLRSLPQIAMCVPCQMIAANFPCAVLNHYELDIIDANEIQAPSYNDEPDTEYEFKPTTCSECKHRHENESQSELDPSACQTCCERLQSKRTADTCTDCTLRHRLVRKRDCAICEVPCCSFDGLCPDCWLGTRALLQHYKERMPPVDFLGLILSTDPNDMACVACGKGGCTMVCAGCCNEDAAVLAAQGTPRRRPTKAEQRADQLQFFRYLRTAGVIVPFCSAHCQAIFWPIHSLICLNAPNMVTEAGRPVESPLLPPQTGLRDIGNMVKQRQDSTNAEKRYHLLERDARGPVRDFTLVGEIRPTWIEQFALGLSMTNCWEPMSRVNLPRLFARQRTCSRKRLDCSVISNWHTTLNFTYEDTNDTLRALRDMEINKVTSLIGPDIEPPGSLQRITRRKWPTLLYEAPLTYWRLIASRPGGTQCMSEGCQNRATQGSLLCGDPHLYQSGCTSCNIPSAIQTHPSAHPNESRLYACQEEYDAIATDQYGRRIPREYLELPDFY